jgi:hypothetical protein
MTEHSTNTSAAVAPPSRGAIRISDHAVGQYAERVKPGLAPDAARAELERLAADHGELVRAAPAWARDAAVRPFFLVIAGSLCLPLARDHVGRWAATTCLVHTGGSERATRARRAHKARRRRSAS